MGIQTLTAFKFSNKTDRSTCRSRTSGNLLSGSTRIGCSRLSTSDEQAMRARPLMRIAQEPQISSRQFESYVIGVVLWPLAVTGLPAISIIAEMTFMPGRHSISKPSQTAGASGLAWRLISKDTVFFAIVRFPFLNSLGLKGPA